MAAKGRFAQHMALANTGHLPILGERALCEASRSVIKTREVDSFLTPGCQADSHLPQIPSVHDSCPLVPGIAPADLT
jgi:hypothetical protein